MGRDARPEIWMKSLFKATLLATTMAVAMHAPITFAADAVKPAATADISKAAFKKTTIKSGLCAGRLVVKRAWKNSLKEQKSWASNFG